MKLIINKVISRLPSINKKLRVAVTLLKIECLANIPRINIKNI